MFKKGTFRQKQGVVTEGRQTKFYHDDSDNTPMDVVDHYLLDRFNIVLQHNRQEDERDLSIESDPAEKTKNK